MYGFLVLTKSGYKNSADITTGRVVLKYALTNPSSVIEIPSDLPYNSSNSVGIIKVLDNLVPPGYDYVDKTITIRPQYQLTQSSSDFILYVVAIS